MHLNRTLYKGKNETLNFTNTCLSIFKPIFEKNFIHLTKSSRCVDVELYNLLALLLRDFVLTWYDSISQDPEFLSEIVYTFSNITQELEDRCSKVDWTKLIVYNFSSILKRHYQDFRLCKSKVGTSQAGYATFETLFHGIQPHFALSSSEAEKEYLRELSERMLRILLPVEEYESDTVRYLLREIMTCTVLTNVVNSLSDPYTINNIIVKSLGPIAIPSTEIQLKGGNAESVAKSQDSLEGSQNLPSTPKYNAQPARELHVYSNSTRRARRHRKSLTSSTRPTISLINPKQLNGAYTSYRPSTSDKDEVKGAQKFSFHHNRSSVSNIENDNPVSNPQETSNIFSFSLLVNLWAMGIKLFWNRIVSIPNRFFGAIYRFLEMKQFGMHSFKMHSRLERPLVELVNEMLLISERNRWLYSQVELLVLPLVRLIGGSWIDIFIENQIKSALSEPRLAYYLEQARNSLWPNGVFFTGAEISPDERLRTKHEAERIVNQLIPENVKRLILGNSRSDCLAQDILTPFQSEAANRHLVFALIDSVISEIVPEFTEQKEFQRY
ncbi:PXA-domain-containing protein [Basidiobolus meristosporus CBS 931.73]|uniref:PXA-domain-containing protein n=1 Tax=Basidiobolus meristosporus CBS 931.73 TaxID=1314790 RepID=A0A1Y1YBU3_9FUNG|nr:PXA-domain-containing protein [Basidiobolus meristosporus CBS 931.73]|eukprot:ORX95521.1 PXA-domain-containing protein [Basidiobolus meristosporus CBS 931.73]